jgi:hypothetical protein
VLVLNSDTVLGQGWALALSTSAYAYPDVATVSPLSNGAGFFSVPTSNQWNEVPPGWSVEDCASILSWLAPGMHEQVPAASGFCWYVRGDALDVLGRLDDAMFHRGYAEETDFCLRAGDAGWKNLCLLAHYAAHAGGESFTTEKSSLKKTNAKILGAMQPTFLSRLIAYEAESVIPRLGAAFGEATLVPPASAGFAAGGSELAIVVAKSLASTTTDATLGLELHGGRARLVLGAHESSAPVSPQHWSELVSYLVLRLRPKRLVDEAGLLEPLASRAAAVVGTEARRRDIGGPP